MALAGVATVARLHDEIREVRYREATTTFCRLVSEQARPLRAMIKEAIAAAAPYVQVPSHMMRLPSGEMRGVNYDHTILGWRGAISLMNELGGTRGILPNVQAMWYVPQGLNVWEQVICQFPGHYARDGEQCNRKFPGPDDHVNRFDGPAWNVPKIYFRDHDPIEDGSVDDRLARMNWAIAEGDKAEAYGLFLGLAKQPEHRERLKDAILFSGIIDLQDTIINRGGYQNIGHKALRARALVDIADYLGWDDAHELMYTVVPDLGCSPHLHGLWNEISNICRIELPDQAAIPKRSDKPLTEQELDVLTETLLWGGPFEVNAGITALFRRGAGILDIGDAVMVCFQRYLIDVLEHPNAFLHPTHALDYMNVVQSWTRNHDNPHQLKGVFLGARFMNDTIRSNASFPRDPSFALEPRSAYRAWADDIAIDRLLPMLKQYVLAQDAPRSCALVDSYLDRTAERNDLLDTITYAACHWQNDPHVMRNCASSLEEYRHNRTTRRDDIIRGFVKHQSRYVKRAPTHDCYQLYVQHFQQANDA
ncbi:MAG TPA: hypothetical protein VFL55_17605 [Acetobacteraceae bacterium]|nr:hypothetical protein [Acetobacteraceae bacterium]